MITIKQDAEGKAVVDAVLAADAVRKYVDLLVAWLRGEYPGLTKEQVIAKATGEMVDVLGEAVYEGLYGEGACLRCSATTAKVQVVGPLAIRTQIICRCGSAAQANDAAFAAELDRKLAVRTAKARIARRIERVKAAKVRA